MSSVSATAGADALLRMRGRGPWSVLQAPRADSHATTATVAVNTGEDGLNAVDERSVGGRGGDRSAWAIERERIRIELAGGVDPNLRPHELPPIGYVYDTVPDITEEAAYDALEKVYNAAFTVSSPERLKRADAIEKATATLPAATSESAEADVPSAETWKLATSAIEHAIDVTSTIDLTWWKELKSDKELRRQSVLQMRNRVGGTMTSDGRELWERCVLRCNPSVETVARGVASRRMAKHSSLRGLAKDCVAIARQRSQPSPKEANVLIPPVAIKVEPVSLDVSGVPDSSILAHSQRSTAMSDHLVSEVLKYTEALHTGSGRSLKCPTKENMMVPLIADHNRALSDFDASRQFSAAGVKSVIFDSSSSKEFIRTNAKFEQTNPFQINTAIQSSEGKTTFSRLLAQSTLGSSRLNTPGKLADAVISLASLIKQGSNALIVDERGSRQAPHAVISLIRYLLPSWNHRSGLLVVTSHREIGGWKMLFMKYSVRVFECWGEKMDREIAIRAFLAHAGEPSVLLVPYESVTEDANLLMQEPWQLCILDPGVRRWEDDIVQAAWRVSLALYCRHRVLVCDPDADFDCRHLLQFLFPVLFSSRRSMMAWNCPALSMDSIAQICSVLSSYTTTCKDTSAVVEFLQRVQQTTWVKSKVELVRLDGLEKEGQMITPIPSPLRVTERSPRPKTPRRRKNIPEPIVTSTSIKYENRSVPVSKNILRGGRKPEPGGKSRRRKRISRCGTCAGCLAEDCMKCGHCKDMKKYGGPGLRKQSCKNRKCLNPKRWRTQGKSSTPRPSQSPSGMNSSDQGDADSDEESCFSEGSEPDSIVGKNMEYPALLESSDSDSALLDSTDRGEESDHLGASSGGEDHSKAGRQRVMRCGTCTGCTSGDCMTCGHCLDMKKYGGPGLRKQSCKNRKCVAPKVVVLNQGKEGDRDGSSIGTRSDIDISDRESTTPRRSAKNGNDHGPLEDTDQNGHHDLLGVDDDKLNAPSRQTLLLLIQEWELLCRPHLKFRCQSCPTAYHTQRELDHHVLAQHPPSGGRSPSSWSRAADRLLRHPCHQLCMLLAQATPQRGPHLGPIPGFASLQGQGFTYYFFKPRVVLGRMSSPWAQLYRDRGIGDPRGLPAEDLDCHLGFDGMIAHRHALIQWEPRKGCFTIACLSLRSSISVNGREVAYASQPLALASRDLIQIGAATVYLLLPTATPETALPPPRTALPRTEVEAWLGARVKKRRAIRSREEAIARKIRARISDARMASSASIDQ